MRHVRIAGIVLLGMTGCSGDDNFSYAGYVMQDFFPFDGARTWEFVSTDQTIPYKMTSVLLPDTELEENGNVTVYSVEYRTECVGSDNCDESMEGWVRTVKLSSDRSRGTVLWGWDSPETGPVSFSPPIEITDATMEVNDVVHATVDGTTWSSKFVAVVECPVLWTDQWNECVEFEVCDGDIAAGVCNGGGHPLAGTYYAVPSYNIVAFQLTGDTGLWQLIKATYE